MSSRPPRLERYAEPTLATVPSGFTRSEVIGLVLLIGAFLLTIVIVDPRGNFPLNDDWSFATSTRRILLEHDWRPSFWGNMSLLSNALWGASFCVLSGCSFEVLRASSLLAAVLLMLVTHRFLRRLGATPFHAALGTALTTFNPVLMELSFTFMTDVFFTFVLVASALCFCEALRGGTIRSLMLATGLAVIATLSRQVALCLSIGFALVSLWQHWRTSAGILRSVLPVSICFAAQASYEVWMNHTGRTPSLYYVKNVQLYALFRDPPAVLSNLFFNSVIVIVYAGLFTAPLTLSLRRVPHHGRIGRAVTGGAGLVTAICLASILGKLGSMPIQGNILIPQGLGPLILRDTHILHLDQVPALPHMLWLAVTGLSLVGVYKLSALLFSIIGHSPNLPAAPRGTTNRAIVVYLLLCIAIYFLPFVPAHVFERYTASMVPLICALCVHVGMAGRPQTWQRSLTSVGLAALMALFAILGTHDYLSWNRARWRLIADLTRTGTVGPTNLDGGFEYNGEAFEAQGYDVTAGKSWWWIKDDLYVVSFGPILGYEAIGTARYQTYLPLGHRLIYALKRS